MKILYPLGDGSQHANQEFRWSLRSLEKNCLVVDGVVQDIEPVVVGSVPEWFTGKSIRFVEKQGRKEKNILAKIMLAIEEGLVDDEFQISADDHFWNKPVKLSELPRYYRDPAVIPDFPKGGNNHDKALDGTKRVLLANGYPAMNFSLHCNQWVHPDDIREVRDLLRAAESNEYAREYGMINWALWPNVGVTKRRRPIAWKRDVKFGNVPKEVMAGLAANEIILSINDDAFSSPAFLEYMGNTFPDKSRWEA